MTKSCSGLLTVYCSYHRCIGLYVPVIVMTLCIEASGHCESGQRSSCPRNSSLTVSPSGITLFTIFVLWERNTKIKRIMVLVSATSYIVAFAMLIKFLRPVVGAPHFVGAGACKVYSHRSSLQRIPISSLRLPTKPKRLSARVPTCSTRSCR